jgi:hypothetical protein
MDWQRWSMPPTLRTVRFPFVLLALAFPVLGVLGCERKSAPPTAPDPAPPAARAATVGAADAGDGAEGHRQFAKVEFPEVPIRAGAPTTVHVAWKSPAGTGVNEEAPFKVRWTHSDALAEAPSDVKATGTAARDGFRIVVKPLDGAPNATVTGVIDLVVCDIATHSVCTPVRRKVEIEFVVGKTAAAETTVTVDLPQAKPM